MLQFSQTKLEKFPEVWDKFTCYIKKYALFNYDGVVVCLKRLQQNPQNLGKNENLQGLYSLLFLERVTMIYINNWKVVFKTKGAKVYSRFVLKNHLTAAYLYIRAENNSTGCTSIHRGFCKKWYCSIWFILNQSSQLWIKEK